MDATLRRGRHQGPDRDRRMEGPQVGRQIRACRDRGRCKAGGAAADAEGEDGMIMHRFRLCALGLTAERKILFGKEYGVCPLVSECPDNVVCGYAQSRRIIKSIADGETAES